MYPICDTLWVLWTSEGVDVQYQASVFNPLKYSGYYMHHVI